MSVHNTYRMCVCVCLSLFMLCASAVPPDHHLAVCVCVQDDEGAFFSKQSGGVKGGVPLVQQLKHKVRYFLTD